MPPSPGRVAEAEPLAAEARNKPWKFKHLTVNQVYRPLAKSSGHILALVGSRR